MNRIFRQRLQRGSVLITTLLMLVVLTIMAVSQISLNSTQTHIATNATDAHIAFQTAEGALSDATNNLLANTYTASSFLSNANGLYLLDPNAPPLWTTVDWTNPNSVIMSFQGSSVAPAAFIIEQLPSVIAEGQSLGAETQVYRITVRAVGASGGSAIIIQSTLKVQL
jgi:type IV pilus assembly protein PilX